jgi:hypothetical protein
LPAVCLPTLLVGGKDNPAEKVEDGENSRDDNGCSLCNGVVDDPWPESSMSSLNKEWAKRLPNGSN